MYLLVFNETDIFNEQFTKFYILTLLACLACNLFITGINQVYDQKIDVLNKPHLPLITGELTLFEGKVISYFGLLLALIISFSLSFYFGCLIGLILVLGSAYSIPPIRFKRFHLWAALAISLVRGPLVNIGVALHMIYFRDGQYHIDFWMLPLTIFMTCFSLGIAWFKDLPDTDGDLKNNIQTVAVRFSRKTALRLGMGTVVLGYLFLVFWGILTYSNLNPQLSHHTQLFQSKIIYFIVFQLFALFTFLYIANKTDITVQSSLKKFYKLYWVLFFLEYFSFLILN